ncbi:hypothetical protein SSBR45G_38600 [Bradyrhizobium sp. SSBR45G]|uniref:hypothetical protein n=1 Tax=unclassified Bradyrhizobium TaxID=2631580 RepID=UPI002342B299|nr:MULTISPECIES: hypothetical protein [unclassified Bradyrhizobium]GLH78951.1 hypothetical protein SSBR45G_38600 [Bradyrhizobium sp. SSBR45G]GLH85274.1 hypothetical protein SSBR45R_27340 [Bradyrhizobium sp. SSBR45R]
MSERSVSIIAGGTGFHPVSHYECPADLLNDSSLSPAEKRLILSSWASDMYAVESQPHLRKIPGIGRPLHLADVLGALRQLDREDQPPRPRGGAAMRIVPRVDVNADAAAADAAPAAGVRLRPAARVRFSREANVQRYRKLLATRLADHERRFVERRLAEELEQPPVLPERRGFARAGRC